MARLCVPGLPFRKDPVPTASRFSSLPAFRSFPHHQRVVFRRNVDLPIPRPPSPSRVPTHSPKSANHVHSFTRCVGTAAVRRTPVRRGAAAGNQLKETLSRLKERRAQARSTTKPPLPRRPEPTPTPATYVRMTARDMVARIDEVLAKYAATRDRVNRVPVSCLSAVRKDKPKKRVRFCETTEVQSVPRWIERKEHVFPAFLSCLGHLQGWKVTALREPDEDGEMEKHTTYLGLARVQARRPAWQAPTVFSGWLKMREMLRERGEFRL
ncbi:hypothetical protein BO99DRAFT_421502 [Aspergillus violaceofuscus CBS 115571]|uniref:Uncharacterized protein n=1 Tax=Aspergillus violaceofuscus (strain CBS 115571) TaxID=1450538 RepID=A0A2V5HDV8_ASPV1|nr:hypothetical protein BO99DRAFT_421502 [Aspergillus violaceofuscus CBS 115571]